VRREKKYWLDDPRNVSKLYYALIAVCALLVIAELFFHKHGHFHWENWFGFFAWYGFGVFCFIVLAGKHLRKLLMRDEDYYDR
jgi:hypothetical protein